MLQRHQRPQRTDRRLILHHLVDDSSEANRLLAQFRADQRRSLGGDVALGEHEIDDGEHGLDARFNETLDRRHGEGDAGRDRILRLARVIRAAIVDSLTRNKRAISLTRRPATRRNVSAALDPAGIAGWQHMKISRSRSSAIATASSRRSRERWRGTLVDDEERQLAGGHRLGAQRVDDLAPGGGQQPGGRVRRHPAARPGPRRRGVGLLDRVLGEVDALELADQQGDEPAPVLGRGGDVERSATGRISMVYSGRARMASMTSSRLGASTR